jgi:hypothetical protein
VFLIPYADWIFCFNKWLTNVAWLAA